MPTIKIKNFLIIKDAEFDIKKINVIIGEQATGKSVIAKLVYFFNRFFSEAFIGASDHKKIKEDIQKEILSKFIEIFPHYSWHNQEFSIAYQSDIYEVKLHHKKINDKYDVSVEYSEALDNLYIDLQERFNENFIQKIEEYKKDDQYKKDKIFKDFEEIRKNLTPQNASIINEKLEEINKRLDIYNLITGGTQKEKTKKFIYRFKKDSIFIPTARSFFILIGNNIYSLLKNDIKLDIFMKEFGSLWEKAKFSPIPQALIDGLSNLFKDVTINNAPLHPSEIIENITKKILRGRYIHENNEDFIEHHDGSKIRLKDASSGQQEALPMLMILSKLLDIEEDKEKSTMVFIEEPEAHLFPKSQKAMISLIATIANARDCPFVLTTHSPYILSAINNLIVGADAFEKIKDNPDKIAELEEFIPQSETVRFEEVSVYTLADGTLTSIMDAENRLIGTDIIDGVSIEFADAFDKACEFLYGDV